MIGNLQNSFEELLDNEAVRILGQILVKYEKKEKVNKSFEQLIQSLSKDKYQYFNIELLRKIHRLLPSNLCEDFTGEYVLITKEKHRQHHLKSYEKFCVKSKNHKVASKQLAKIIVDFCLSDPTCDDDLLQLMASNMAKILPEHNDSVDSRVILMYLQQDIINKGFIITNPAPLRIELIS